MPATQTTVYLIVNPGTDAAWEIPLGEGIHSIGRSPYCAVQLDDESVRDKHAEIHVFQGQASLMEDAGGDSPPVDIIKHPQFKIGNISLELVVTEIAPTELPAPLHPARQTTSEQTSEHKESSDDAGDRWPLIRGIAKAFAYPLAGDARYVVVAGAIVFTVCDYFSLVAGIIGLLIQIGITGLMARYAREIVSATVTGHDDEPRWPDISNFYEDLIQPALEMFVVCFLSFGPLIFAHSYAQFHPENHTLAILAGDLWAGLSFPIFFLLLAVTDSLAALLYPRLTVRAVLRSFPDYLLICGVALAVVASGSLLDMLPRSMIILHVAATLAGWLYEIYGVTVLARCIGLYYRFNRDAFDR